MNEYLADPNLWNGIAFFVLFLIVFLLNRNATTFVLCAAALVNILIFPYTNVYHVRVEATLNFVVLSALIALEDKELRLQKILLCVLLLLNGLFELDQSFSTNFIFSDYDDAVTVVTVLQLIGASSGVFARISERLCRTDNDSILSDRGLFSVEVETCRKK